MAVTSPGDSILVPTPTYPIHTYAFILSNADVIQVPMNRDVDFFEALLDTFKRNWPRPKALIINFPANPTTEIVEIEFFEKIVEMAREHEIWVVQDFAYADLCFDGYEAPSILQVEGAKEVAVEFFSLSKSYNMPGWRVGFCCGNKDLLAALSRIKSYFDYGLFTPIQVAAIKALDEGDEHVFAIKETYKSRRDILVKGLNNSGWPTDTPKATMFVWSKIPDSMINLGSLEFSKRLLTEAKVAVSPGIGFGDYGEGYVRFSLIENEHRIKQAVRSIKKFISSQEKIHVLG